MPSRPYRQREKSLDTMEEIQLSKNRNPILRKEPLLNTQRHLVSQPVCFSSNTRNNQSQSPVDSPDVQESRTTAITSQGRTNSDTLNFTASWLSDSIFTLLSFKSIAIPHARRKREQGRGQNLDRSHLQDLRLKIYSSDEDSIHLYPLTKTPLEASVEPLPSGGLIGKKIGQNFSTLLMSFYQKVR